MSPTIVDSVHTRPKLSIQGQIEYMRDSRGIKFNIVNETQAASFLSSSNYYFKLKSFEKNYSTYPVTDALVQSGKAQKYCNLEFAYLKELSTLDMYFRKMVLALALDVEHFLRVRLMRDVSENDAEDGYSIVQSFLTHQPHVRDKIQSKKKDSYCEQLIDKYSSDYPIWVFIEVLSLGELINFCDIYYSKYPARDISLGSLRIVKFIRNAAAHNNCLLNNLADNSGASFTQNREANSFLSTIDGLSQKVRTKKMGNRTIHDFVVLLCMFSKLVSPDVKKHQLLKLQRLINDRFYYHLDYFEDNMLITTNFNFLKKVVDKMVSTCI